MFNIDAEIEKIIAAMLTIAWSNTKQRDVSQTEIKNVYKQFLKG